MEQNTVKKGVSNKLVIVVVVILAVAALIYNCVTTIPAGYTGIVTTFGKVSDYVLDSGLQVKLPYQKVIKMDNRIQKQTISMSCFSADIQEVNLQYTLNYRINEKDAMSIYKNIGIDYYNTVIVPSINEAVKQGTAKYTAEELIENRTELAEGIEEILVNKLKDYSIVVVDTAVENMDFTDAYTDAVEAKQVAQQNKLKAETEAQQKLIEAEAAANVKKINADAEAYELTVKAQAEAEANETITKSLTDEILKKMYYDSWNGSLPQVITGDSGSILMELPVNTGEQAEEQTEEAGE